MIARLLDSMWLKSCMTKHNNNELLILHVIYKNIHDIREILETRGNVQPS